MKYKINIVKKPNPQTEIKTLRRELSQLRKAHHELRCKYTDLGKESNELRSRLFARLVMKGDK